VKEKKRKKKQRKEEGKYPVVFWTDGKGNYVAYNTLAKPGSTWQVFRYILDQL
jgi:hypothetical protein